MSRRVALRWLGFGTSGCLLAGLAACGSLYRTAEREPWRANVEAQCLASGVVRETAGVQLTKPIEGPGVCGIDHPFRVSALESILGDRPKLAVLRDPPALDPGQPLQLPGADGVDPLAPGGTTPLDLAAPIPRYGSTAASAQVGSQTAHVPAGFTPLPDLPAQPAPVQLQSNGPIAVSLDRSVTLSCSMVPALQSWLTASVQPAAVAAFGSPIVEMTSFGTYSCRRMDNRRVGHMSEHAYANAIDVKGFVLANGRSIKILSGWRGAADEQAFWRDIAYGACNAFNTVLGPGASDGLHENHLHLDLARHGARQLHICRPRVPAGWLPLALRREVPMAARPTPDPAYTGSIEEPLPGDDQD